jgi:hypothetical protein
MKTLRLVVWAVTLVPAALFLGLYTNTLPSPLVTGLGMASKLFLQILGAMLAARCARAFEPGNPLRPAWSGIGIGLLGFALGQADLAFYTFRGLETPFPAFGDIFFVAAYPFTMSALLLAIRAYDVAGYVSISPRARWRIAAVTTIGAAVVGYVVLRPIAMTPAPYLERMLNIGYPALDLVTMIPLTVLFAVTWRFRTGSIGRLWLTLLLGFVILFVADVLFAHATTLNEQVLQPLLNAMFVLGYGFVASAVVQQYRLLR